LIALYVESVLERLSQLPRCLPATLQQLSLSFNSIASFDADIAERLPSLLSLDLGTYTPPEQAVSLCVRS
jgi:hypothetical protein